MLVCKLAEIMQKKNLTLEKLSKLSGVNLSTLEKYYGNTIKRINFRTLDKLCKTLNCKFDDLFKREFH